jgi:hypothetical protein
MIMSDEERKEDEDVETNDEVETVSAGDFGITEAPKNHPDNEDGNMKIIMG